MIITITLIIGTAVGLGTGLIGGGAFGYAIARRRRTEIEADENYDRMINYYSQPHSPEEQRRSVFTRL